MDIGIQTLDWLFNEQLKIDKEWSIQTTNGFKWWADKHAQTIEVIGKEFNQDGMEGDFISIRTDLLKDVVLTDRNLEIINSLLMSFLSMSGPVYDAERQILSLCSLVRVHNEISEWMNPLISVAAVLQVAEARMFSSDLAMRMNATDAISAHPEYAERLIPDELVELIDALIIPAGKEPSSWEEHEYNIMEQFLHEAPALWGGEVSEKSLVVEFPYNDQLSYCLIASDEPQPLYGNGLFIMQSFPVSEMTEIEGARLALAMNEIELTQEPLGYGFGSYVYSDGLLRFVSFFPNAIHRPGILPNIFYSCATRVEEVSIRLSHGNWRSLLNI